MKQRSPSPTDTELLPPDTAASPQTLADAIFPRPTMHALWLAARPQNSVAASETATPPATHIEHADLIAQLRRSACAAHDARSAADIVAGTKRCAVVFVEHSENEDAWTTRWRAVRAASPDALGVLVVKELSTQAMHCAMRERMFDCLCAGDLSHVPVLLARVRKRRNELDEAAQRLKRLKRRCQALEASRRELLAQVSGLVGGMNDTYQSLAGTIRQSKMIAEFQTLVRQELDIEGLLRTTLEYILKKTGPTNGAIFLPNSYGDFTLGAYINYDCPKESAGTLFSQLADTVAPHFEHARDIRIVRKMREFGLQTIECDHWLADSAAAIQAIWYDGECLAILSFFRDSRNSFAQELAPTLTMLGEQFGDQLARVIRTHHRHKPKDQWGSAGGDDSLAA